MIRHYLKTAWRTIVKGKTYATINIIGLTIGLSACMLLFTVVIATPAAWWAMNQWLQNYAYRIDLEWWMFAGAGLFILVIALLTVSWQAIRAAVANPVDSLRDE